MEHDFIHNLKGRTADVQTKCLNNYDKSVNIFNLVGVRRFTSERKSMGCLPKRTDLNVVMDTMKCINIKSDGTTHPTAPPHV